MTDRFAIYHDILKAKEIMIHNIDCTAYKDRDILAKSSDWHTAPDIQTATDTAQRLAREHSMNYRDCKQCKPSSS